MYELNGSLAQESIRSLPLNRGSVLAVPFHSGPSGTVKKIALGEPGRGQHFQKTVIISQCPGVYNPGAYDFKSSVDVCVITGLELSFSVIAGNSRGDYPLSSYRCVVLPNTTYHLTVFQHHAGNRPPYTANTDTTCTHVPMWCSRVDSLMGFRPWQLRVQLHSLSHFKLHRV